MAVHLGSSLLIVSMGRSFLLLIGETLLLFEEAVLGHAIPMLSFTHITNSASVGSDICVGPSFSVLAGTSLGDSLSIRQSLRVGSGVSLFRSDLLNHQCLLSTLEPLAASLMCVATAQWVLESPPSVRLA